MPRARPRSASGFRQRSTVNDVPTTTYQVTIGDRVVEVALRRDGDAVYARVDAGEEIPVRLWQVSDPLYSLAVGHQRRELAARRAGGAVTLALGGRLYEGEVVDAARARLASVAGGGARGHARRELKAPMPGLVVRVLCQAGDTVAAGQPLVVLQAMKMENELSLAMAGTVASVAVGPAQTVDQGQVLVVLE